jgi:hypothetical protein
MVAIVPGKAAPCGGYSRGYPEAAFADNRFNLGPSQQPSDRTKEAVIVMAALSLDKAWIRLKPAGSDPRPVPPDQLRSGRGDVPVAPLRIRARRRRGRPKFFRSFAMAQGETGPTPRELNVTRIHSVHAIRSIAAASLLFLLGFGPVQAEDPLEVQPSVPLAAHHATYKLSLMKAKGANAPAAAAGLIDYVFSGSACDGYTTNFRQMTELQPTEGEARLNDMHSTTYEDGPGTQYTFDTKTTNDQETVNDIDGRAQKADGKVSVELRRPTGTIAFGPDVLFPTEHLRKIITVAKSGGKLLSASVYDGSDTGKKLYNTLTVIGAASQSQTNDAAEKSDVLRSMRRWPVAISYFEAKDEDKPDYVLSFDLYENGVSRALKLDYGDFVLSGDLTDLSFSAPSACPK